MADIFYTDAPIVDESPRYAWPAAEPARRKHRLRAWPWAVLATLLALLLPVGLYLAGLVSTDLALAGAAVMLLELVIWLTLAWRADRL
jgi:hypothetical protein